MLEWLKKRRQKKIEKSGGMQSKREVISRKESIAESILNDRQIIEEHRWHDVPLSGFADRRTQKA
jgi:hypothetical protein